MTMVPQPGDLTACTYDAWNWLVEVKLAGGNVVMKNEYDPFGGLRVKSSGLNHRIKTHVNGTPAADNTYDEFHHFFCNNRWQGLGGHSCLPSIWLEFTELNTR